MGECFAISVVPDKYNSADVVNISHREMPE